MNVLFLQRLSTLKRFSFSFYIVPSFCFVCVCMCFSFFFSFCLNHRHLHAFMRRSETTSLVPRRASPTMLAIAVERWVNRKTGGQTDAHADRQTDGTRLACGHAKTTTQRSIYNFLNMFRITMYLYLESDFFSSVFHIQGYSGYTWLSAYVPMKSL